MVNTRCPNLVEWLDWAIFLCEKGDRPYVPDLSELLQYCTSRYYNKCPFCANFGELVSNVKNFDSKNDLKGNEQRGSKRDEYSNKQ